MSAIAEWLTSLGLSEYTGRFMENGIDTSVLPDLTDQDLKDLGVLLGHRRKMLRAIRDLGNVSVSVAAPAAPVETEPARKDDAERRQLTVMLTDLVGSTALSTQLDPEDMRAMIGAYHKCVAETVARFDGFVAKYMGDGVLVYFGYPHAHEDDAERAVRAGLALVEAVGKLQVQEPLWPPAPRPEEAASLFSSTIRGRRAFHLRRPAAPDTFFNCPRRCASSVDWRVGRFGTSHQRGRCRSVRWDGLCRRRRRHIDSVLVAIEPAQLGLAAAESRPSKCNQAGACGSGCSILPAS